MSETPRKRLASLMDGLDLPKGFRLTPAREACLTVLGRSILTDGELTCSGPYLRLRNMRCGWRLTRTVKAREKAVFRGMVKAKWVMLEQLPDVPGGYWRDRQVIFQEGLKQLALRLGAKSVLWEERRQAVMEAAEKPQAELRAALYEAQRTISRMTSNPTFVGNENDVLNAYRKVRELSSGLMEAEKELAHAREVIRAIPEPSEDDAIAWLMSRRLNGPKED